MEPTLLLVLFGALQAVAIVGGGFYFVGRISKTQETLATIVKDHEIRLRVIEQQRLEPLYSQTAHLR